MTRVIETLFDMLKALGTLGEDRQSSKGDPEPEVCSSGIGDVNNIACQIEYGDELDAWRNRDINPLDDENERFRPWG